MNRTIHEAAAAIRRGELTPLDLLDECLARIDLLEEKVRAWAYLDREGARADAERLTQELKKGQDRGPLHGIPLGIKDIIDVFDMPTGCGSKRWANSYARRDATVVQRLRQAGAVILGKTVTTAYASFDPPPTRNPWDLTRTPGGSSSGSAAAVACGMCLGALATQTGGSITRPASFCGVCSIKPTYRSVSVRGVLPLAKSMDHVGAMANCVRDLAIIYQTITREETPPNYLSSIDEKLADQERSFCLQKIQGMFDLAAEPVMRDVIANLSMYSESKGWATIERREPPVNFADIIPRHRMVMAVEAAAFHGKRFHRHPEDYPPRVSELIEEGLRCPAIEYRRTMDRKFIDSELLNNSVHCRIYFTPATTGPAPDAATTGDPIFNSPWSYTGLPTVSLPFSWTKEGLPLCIQLIGWRWSDGIVLAAAAECERSINFPWRDVRVL